MILIGITGTLGAGKGTIVRYLVEDYHFNHYSVREYLKERAAERGILKPNRDDFTLLANELRRNHSPSYIIDELYRAASLKGKCHYRKYPYARRGGNVAGKREFLFNSC